MSTQESLVWWLGFLVTLNLVLALLTRVEKYLPDSWFERDGDE